MYATLEPLLHQCNEAIKWRMSGDDAEFADRIRFCVRYWHKMR